MQRNWLKYFKVFDFDGRNIWENWSNWQEKHILSDKNNLGLHGSMSNLGNGSHNNEVVLVRTTGHKVDLDQ